MSSSAVMVVVACAGAALMVVGALLRRSAGSLVATVFVAAVLVGLVETPERYQSWLAVSAAALLGLLAGTSPSSRLSWAGALGGVAGLVVAIIPGGVGTAVLAVLAFAGYFNARGAARHLIRLSLAARLDPERRPSREVEIAGRVRGEDAPVPGLDLSAACWSLVRGPRAEGQWPTSSGRLAIEGEHGVAYVELEGADVHDPRHALDRDQLIRLLREVDPTLAERVGPEATGSLQIFRAGQEVYAVGIPTWEAVSDAGPAYRDAAVAPVFRRRSKDQPRVFVASRSEAQIRLDSWWTLATWLVWGAVSAIVAAHLVLRS